MSDRDAGPDVLRLQGLRKSYNVGKPTEVEVLHGLDLRLQRHDFAALVGASGSGKSTLLNLVGLLDTPTAGELFLLGEATRDMDDARRTALRGGAIGFVFQFHHLIQAFTALVDQVMSQQPYACAKRVFWIVDNGSSHRGQAALDRLAARYPNAIMVHTPVHASWLNQVEIYFSIIQRKVLSPNDFADLIAVEQRLLAFEDRYNATAIPFKWKYTTTDLNRHLERIDQHERISHAA